MGSYVTTGSLEPYMVGTDFDTAASDTSVLASNCIDWAETEINKHLAERYATAGWTSTANTPPHVITLGEQLAIGYMYETMSRGGKESMTRADRYIKRVMENLEDLKNNKANLLDTSGSIVSDQSSRRAVLCNTSDHSETFNEDDPLLWNVDQDKLDEISSDRG